MQVHMELPRSWWTPQDKMVLWWFFTLWVYVRIWDNLQYGTPSNWYYWWLVETRHPVNSCPEVSAQCKTILVSFLSGHLFFLKHQNMGIFRRVWGICSIFSRILYDYDRIQPFVNQNVNNNIPTFEFFTLEQWPSPSVSLLNNWTMTTFILKVEFFPLFNVTGTTSGPSL